MMASLLPEVEGKKDKRSAHFGVQAANVSKTPMFAELITGTP